MTFLRVVLLISLVTVAAMSQENSAAQRPKAPTSCPVTLAPTVPFTPDGEREMGQNDKSFWLGTDKLWISLPKAGEVWGWGPRAPGSRDLTAKVFWGSVDFDYRRKEYDLKVTGRRIDGDAPPLWVDRVTNALFVPHAAMLTGVYVPTPGCWEITGEYHGEKLSFVVWVQSFRQGNQ